MPEDEDNGGAIVPHEPAANLPTTQVEKMFSQIMAASTDPNVDPAKMTALVDLQMKMMDYQKQEEFNKAKLAAIMEMPIITKKGAILNKNNQVQSRYSKFEDIHRAVMPILKRHNLVISFNVGHTGQLVTVTPILSHTNGYVEKGEPMALPIDTTGSKNGTQGAGSAASYGKRHSMKAMLNIIEGGEDDDGQSTGKGGAQLSPSQLKLVADAEAAARDGGTYYLDWFQKLSTPEKGWLVYEGRHEEMKKIAGIA